MISLDKTSYFSPKNQKAQGHHIVFEQDAIFSGSEYVNSLLKKFTSIQQESGQAPQEDQDFPIRWHVKDGDCVLKNQTCGTLFLDNNFLNATHAESTNQDGSLKEIVKIISYLSGLRTLARCYMESSEFIPIIGSHTQSFKLWDWELKTLNAEGIIASPQLPQKICYCQKDLDFALKSCWSCIAFSTKIPFETIKDFLTEVPHSVTTGIYGDILPQDLQKWSRLNVNAIWPESLQGHFPYVKITHSQI